MDAEALAQGNTVRFPKGQNAQQWAELMFQLFDAMRADLEAQKKAAAPAPAAAASRELPESLKEAPPSPLEQAKARGETVDGVFDALHGEKPRKAPDIDEVFSSLKGRP